MFPNDWTRTEAADGGASTLATEHDPHPHRPLRKLAPLPPCASPLPPVRRLRVATADDAAALTRAIAAPCARVYVDWFGTVELTEPIRLGARATLTVNGASAAVGGAPSAVIAGGGGSGGAAVRLFELRNNSALRLQDVVLRGGSADSGGAVWAGQDSKVWLTRVVAHSNNATDGGGALYLSPLSTAEITNCSFDFNSADEGAAVFVDLTARATIFNSSFKNGTSQSAGAIYTHGQLIVRQGRFANNTGVQDAGDIFAHGADGEATRDEYPSWTNFTDTSFEDSSAGTGDDGGMVGGSVFTDGGGNATLSMNNCSFVRCTAQRGGGALHIKSNAQLTAVNVTDCTAAYGAAIHIADSAEFGVRISTSVFRGNSAAFAGALYIENGVNADVTVSGCHFIENVAAKDAGGAVLVGSITNTTIAHSTFEGNVAAFRGGALMKQSGASLQLEGNVFRRNRSNYGGAAFFQGIDRTSKQWLQGDTFEGNEAYVNGGALYMEFGVVGAAVACNFTGNRAGKGGAVFLQDTLDFSVTNATFAGNAAAGAGGAVLQERGNATALQLAGAATRFSDNAAGCCNAQSLLAAERGALRDAMNATCADIDAEVGRSCCTAGEYAVPAADMCEFCDDDKLNCDELGITFDALKLRAGYWVAALGLQQSDVVPCFNADACRGGLPLADAARVNTTDGYCAEGYMGPYCAVCASGYSATISQSCERCEGSTAALLAAAAAAVLLVVALLVWWYVSAFTGAGDAQEAAAAGRSSSGAMSGAALSALHALRIPLVVFQIVTQFVSISGVQFPPIYQALVQSEIASFKKDFLRWLSVVNLGVVLLPMSCVFATDFYTTLLVATLAPLAVVAALAAARRCARRRLHTAAPRTTFSSGAASALSLPHDASSAAALARGSGGSREGAQRRRRGLLRCVPRRGACRRFSRGILVVLAERGHQIVLAFTFVIFSGVSTVCFQTFACDTLPGTDARWLRADYSISCDTAKHTYYMAYAAVFVLVYPLGIPALYAWYLWRARDMLRARARLALDVPSTAAIAAAAAGAGTADGAAARGGSTLYRCSGDDVGGGGSGSQHRSSTASLRRSRGVLLLAGPKESLRNALRAALRHESSRLEALRAAEAVPALRSTAFLWRPYRPDRYYWELWECLRRLLLTGALVFTFPGSPGQSAMACALAIVTLAAYGRAAPHATGADARVYTLGGVILALNMLAALLLASGALAGGAHGANILGALLITLNVALLLAAVAQVLFITRTVVQEVSEPLRGKSLSAAAAAAAMGEGSGSGGGGGGGGDSGGSLGSGVGARPQQSPTATAAPDMPAESAPMSHVTADATARAARRSASAYA
ncbi:hypothetical protein JKP88DRAFT_307130 [Tribonema minus]|uniref:Right handed beta helix domain-containing protein n=1 Tax=Tribonema minus TaxID=303371 RepID=A0A836CJI1_9STRA|nr:hypothetical protein JKP88DRAFT_307130 [Tribonema minus]